MALLKLPPLQPSRVWQPISDAQYTASNSAAEMLMFGGAAGPGKTTFILADAVKEYDNPHLRGIIFRESFPQLEQSVLPKMREMYSQMGAYYVGGVKRVWTFPSGAQVRVGVIAKEDDISNYQGGNYSYIGFDESTHHPEQHLRAILPWWRTTDPSLHKRIRLATNPGGIGAGWHMHVFLRNKCPFHFPDQSVEPGGIYRGSHWLTDNAEIPFTVSFIPGRYDDHHMHGGDYSALLKTQEGDRAEQMLNGCWCTLQGAFFKGMRPDQIVPYSSINEQWWWTHYIGIDYGYGNSAAAAGLYCLTPSMPGFPAGRHYKIGEVVERRMDSTEFAEHVMHRFAEPQVQGHRRKIIACYMDPANNSHTGTGRSNMEIMREVFDKWDVPIVRASNDPLGGSQNLLRMLRSGELGLTDLAPETHKALSSRMHDPKRPGCYLKVHGSAEDDLADETRYATNSFISQSETPPEVEIATKMDEYRKAGLDEHSLYIHSVRLANEIAARPTECRTARRHRMTVRMR